MRGWLPTGCVSALAIVALTGLAHAQSVDEIVARNLQARGGVEKLKGMTSAKITGDVDQRGMKIHITTWAKRPNFMRREMDATPPPPSPGRASIPGTTGPIKAVVASDGAHVWMINPYHLKLTKKSGLVQHYYLDVETALEVRTASEVEQDGNKATMTTDVSNYQTVDGLTMPFTMKQSLNGTTVAEITISKWEVNIPVDDDLFKMPGKTP